QVIHNPGIEGTHVPFEDAARRGGRKILRHKDILVRDGHSEQGAIFALGAASVGAARLGARYVRPYTKKGVELLMRLNQVEKQVGELNLRDLLGVEQPAELGHRGTVKISHGTLYSITLGTRNRPPCASGALRMLCSRSFGSVTSSARKR